MATRTRLHPYTRPRDSGKPNQPLTKLIVSNLHYEVTEADLKKIFEPYGKFSHDPSIKYDRSGRSTGFAYINYESEVDATAAKDELDGVLAKGEKIHIRLDTASRKFAPKAAEWGEPRARGTAQGSLMDRIGNAPLIQRLGKTDKKEPEQKRSGPGPVRTARMSTGSNPPRRQERSPRPARFKPKTAEDLDKELEAYVHSGADKEEKPAGDDVDMAA